MSVSLLHSGSLLGQSFHRRRFYQDDKPKWIKIDGIRLGRNHEIYDKRSYDIGKTLDDLVEDSDVAVVSYDKESDRVYVGSSFDLESKSDSGKASDFTTYIKKRKAVYAGQALRPQQQAIAPLVPMLLLLYNTRHRACHSTMANFSVNII